MTNKQLDEKALKECPFCGGEAALNQDTFRDHYFGVNCSTPMCSGYTFSPREGQQEAITAWNARHNTTLSSTNAAMQDDAEDILKITVTDQPVNILNPRDFKEIHIKPTPQAAGCNVVERVINAIESTVKFGVRKETTYGAIDSKNTMGSYTVCSSFIENIPEVAKAAIAALNNTQGR
jgi:hypothetical protein